MNKLTHSFCEYTLILSQDFDNSLVNLDNYSNYNNLIIIIEPSVKVTLYAQNRAYTSVSLYLKRAAQVTGLITSAIADITIECAEESSLILIQTLDGTCQHCSYQLSMNGPQAKGLIRIIPLLKDQKKVCLTTTQIHQSSTTCSDLLITGYAQDQASYMHKGHLIIKERVSDISAYHSNKLLLFHQAQATSSPAVNIKSQKISCTHKAAFGPIDKEQIWYLNTFGIPEIIGSNLIVSSFCMQAYVDLKLPDFIHLLLNKIIIDSLKKNFPATL